MEKKRINLIIEDESYLDLKEVCKQLDCTVNFYIRTIINDSVNKFNDRRNKYKRNE